MRVLVCGGRGYGDCHRLFRELDRLHKEHGFTYLMEGGQTGADRHARSWAQSRMIPGKEFRANWGKYGRAAGPLRNARMLKDGKPDMIVAFPGGSGTADMMARARAANVKVLEIGE